MPNVWKDGQWVSIEDLRVAAIAEAQDELRQDLDTVVENGVGTKSFYKPTEPTAAESSGGDLWFDTSEGGNNELHTYVNGAWVSAADARIAAIQQAQAELASELNDVVENGIGTRTHYTPTQPAVADSRDGDLWFDPSDNNKPYVFQDGGWVTIRDSYVAPGAIETINLADKAITTAKIAVGAITAESGVVGSLDAGKITTGYLNGARIEAGSLTADKVLVSSGMDLFTDPSLSLTAKYAPKWTPVPDLPFLQKSGTGTDDGAYFPHTDFSVTPRGSYAVNATAYAYKGTTYYPVQIRIIALDVTGTPYGSPVIASINTNSSATPAVVTMPNATRVRIGFFTGSAVPSDATAFIAAPSIRERVGSTLILPGAITTEKIAVGAITAESGVVASLDAGKITVGTLNSARIAANSITADKVLLGSGDRNLIPNGDLDKGSAANWPSNATYQTTDKPASLPAAVTFPAGAGYNYDFSNMGIFPVTAGEVVILEMWVKADKPNSQLAVAIHDQNGSGGSTANRVTGWTALEGDPKTSSSLPVGSGFIVPTAWTKISARTTIASGVTSIKFQGFYLNYSAGSERGAAVSIAGLRICKAVGSTLIEPGAITTEKIATGAITAESGVIGSLDASKITVGKLSGARLEADAINGMQIIGATIATSTGFPRVQLDTAGLAVYKSSSVRSFFADSATGNLSVIGNLYTGSTGTARVEISTEAWSNAPVFDGYGGIIGSQVGTGIRVGLNDNRSGGVYFTPKMTAAEYDRINIRGPYSRSLISMLGTDSYSYGDILLFARKDGTGGSNAGSSRIDLSGTYNGTSITCWADDGQSYINSALAMDYDSSKIYTMDNGGYASGAFAYRDSHSAMLRGYDVNGSVAASTTTFGKIGRTGIWGTSINPLIVEYGGTAASWLIPFVKSGTNWGYIGSSAAMSTDDFGIQSGSGKRLVLSAAGSSTNITLEPSGHLELNVPTSISAALDERDKPGRSINPLIVEYGGTAASWLIPFVKSGTNWGYIGSSAAMSTDDFGIQSGSGKRLVLSAAGSSTNITLEPSGHLELNVPTSISGSPRLKSTAVWNVVSSSGSSVRVNSSGTLFNDGSSERYKQDIEDAPILTSVLDIQPRTWRERWAVKASEDLAAFREEVIGPVPIELADAPEEAPWYYGAVAEEVHDLGLTEFVQYDAFGRPDGLYYDRMSVALIPFIKELLTRVADLESRLDTPTETAPVE